MPTSLLSFDPATLLTIRSLEEKKLAYNLPALIFNLLSDVEQLGLELFVFFFERFDFLTPALDTLQQFPLSAEIGGLIRPDSRGLDVADVS